MSRCTIVVVVALSAPQAGCLGFRVSGHGKPLRKTPVPSVGDSGQYRSERRNAAAVCLRHNPQSSPPGRAVAAGPPPQPATGRGWDARRAGHPIDSLLVQGAGSQRNRGLIQDGFDHGLQPALPYLGAGVSPGLSHAYLVFPQACSGEAQSSQTLLASPSGAACHRTASVKSQPSPRCRCPFCGA